MIIRNYISSDAETLVKILSENHQYSHSDVEGPVTMERVASCDAAIFLVAEIDGKPVGFVKAIYDGSRALIHLLSIDPSYQRQGIGKQLVQSTIQMLVQRNAPSVSVTVTASSEAFWNKMGFETLPVFLMLKTGLSNNS